MKIIYLYNLCTQCDSGTDTIFKGRVQQKIRCWQRRPWKYFLVTQQTQRTVINITHIIIRYA
jgi:hypothetical protein